LINARIASLTEKNVSQELEFHKIHSIVKSLTRERNQLQKENASWKELHKTGLSSGRKHKAMINDLLHENLKLINYNIELHTICKNLLDDHVKALNLLRSLLLEEVAAEKAELRGRLGL
jgi:hypothetical protein